MARKPPAPPEARKLFLAAPQRRGGFRKITRGNEGAMAYAKIAAKRWRQQLALNGKEQVKREIYSIANGPKRLYVTAMVTFLLAERSLAEAKAFVEFMQPKAKKIKKSLQE